MNDYQQCVFLLRYGLPFFIDMIFIYLKMKWDYRERNWNNLELYLLFFLQVLEQTSFEDLDCDFCVFFCDFCDLCDFCDFCDLGDCDGCDDLYAPTQPYLYPEDGKSCEKIRDLKRIYHQSFAQ